MTNTGLVSLFSAGAAAACFAILSHFAAPSPGSGDGGAPQAAAASAPKTKARQTPPRADYMPGAHHAGVPRVSSPYPPPRSAPAPAAAAPAPEPSAAEQRIRRALDQTADLSYRGDTTLREALDQLAEQHDLPILFDIEGLGAREIDLDAPVDFSRNRLPLASALRLLLRRHLLTYVIEEDVLKVVPDADALARRGAATERWQSLNASDAERLEEALSQPTTIEFLDEPLESVAAYLADRHGVPILIDERSLDEMGMTLDEPITIQLRGTPLASALELLLDQHDLTYTLRGNVIMITTPDAVEANLLLRVYWLAATGLDGEAAARLIQSVIDYSVWEQLGGPATIETVRQEPGHGPAIAVLAPYTTHRQVERLLDSLRGVEERGPAPTEPRQASPLDPSHSAAPDDDPAGESRDPEDDAESEEGEAPANADPFGSDSADPFGSAPADGEDPFGGASPVEEGDPFGGDSGPGTDPFGN